MLYQGYLNNPAGTANALTSDNYFKTGDVGYQDEDGNFFITDRVKELIKYSSSPEGYMACSVVRDSISTCSGFRPALNPFYSERY